MKYIVNNITKKEVMLMIRPNYSNPINDDGTVINRIRKDGVQLITYWQYYTGHENFSTRAISCYRKRYIAIDTDGKEYHGATRAETLKNIKSEKGGDA